MGHYNYDIDDRDSESNFENSYHNPILVWEQCGQNERHGDLGFRASRT
jgi:hypothetical protein